MDSTEGGRDVALSKHHGPHAETSFATVACSTNTCHSRVLNTQIRKEMAKASVKELDVVRRGLRQLETRMHELESRVQYVNPWVVQYMWELLCEIRNKIGVQYSYQRERGLIEEMSLRGRRPQPTTEPRKANSSATPPEQQKQKQQEQQQRAQLRRASASPSVPLRLFDAGVDEDNAEVGDLDTSLSSESSGSVDRTTGEFIVESGPHDSQLGRSSHIHSNRLWQQKMAETVAGMEERMLWQCAVQDECVARMNIAMEESAACSHALVQHMHRISVAVSRVQQQQIQIEPCDKLNQRNIPYACDKQRNEEQFEEPHSSRYARRLNEIPSPPEVFSECSPIAQTGDFLSDLISPPRHRRTTTSSWGNKNNNNNNNKDRDRDKDRSDRSRSDCYLMNEGNNNCFYEARDSAMAMAITEALLSDRDARRSLAEEILRDLSAAMRQHPCSTQTMPNNSKNHYKASDDPHDQTGYDAFASALLLTVREAGAARDATVSDELRQWAVREEAARAEAAEQLWQRIAEREAEWERRTAAELREAQQQQQCVLARSEENAEACGAVRREVLRLYGEVTRAVNQMSERLERPECAERIELEKALDKTRESRVMREWESRFSTLSSSVSDLHADVDSLRARKETQRVKEPQQPQAQEQTQNNAHLLQQQPFLDGGARMKCVESHIATLQETMSDVQETIAIVAHKTRAAEERINSSKANSAAVQVVAERLRVVEQQLDKLPTLLAGTSAALPPPLPSPITEKRNAEQSNGRGGPLYPVSVEAAMVSVQELLLTQRSSRAVNSYAQTLSALCAVLQHVAHLYNSGTGTFGGSLQLIFSMPPFAVPANLLPVCRAYLREHSAAELKEAIGSLAVSRPVAEVLCDCYYWIQSHVLAADSAELRGTENTAKRVDVRSKSIQVKEGSPEKNRKARDAPDRRIKVHEEEKEAAPQREHTAWINDPNAAGEANSQHSSFSGSAATLCGSSKDSAAPSMLEALALMRSPDEPRGGVVHHYHHHHRCRADGSVGCTPPKPDPRLAQAQAQTQKIAPSRGNFSSNGVAGTPLNAANTSDTEERGSTRESVPGGMDATPLFKPRASSSHQHHHQTQKQTIDGNECLPLPTALSAFTDPQMPKCAGGHGRLQMKNPQSFYTATWERHPQQKRTPQLNHNSGGGGGCSGGGDSGDSMSDKNNYRNNNENNGHTSGHTFNARASLGLQSNEPFYSTRSLFATSTRSRDDIVAITKAAQMHRGSYAYRGEGSLAAQRPPTG